MVNISRYSFLLTLLSFSLIAQNRISVYSETDSTEYYVGDYIRYKIVLEYDDNVTVEIPSVKDSINTLEFIEEKLPVKSESEGKIREIREYVFSKYDSSMVRIPAVTIRYSVAGNPTEMYLPTNALEIVVKTLEVNPESDIQDVKAPIRIPLDILFVVLLVLGIIILLIGGYLSYKYVKNKNKGIERIKEVVVIPPHKTAKRRLMELEEKKLWQQGKVKDYHSEITGIIRKYFEDRFNFIALEMPSSDILNHLLTIGGANPILRSTREFFKNADLVKFAKFQPIPSVNEEMMKQAYEIVELTKEESVDTEKEVQHA